MEHPIERAAKSVGNQTLLAAALKVSKGAVSQWKEAGGRVPAEHCPVIERLTGGLVRCEELRPDIEWSVLRREEPGTILAAIVSLEHTHA
ncbi:MAG: helix-turn-helix domain-containing protein [Burkholderiaceae bacterium]|nr:helix-turn-helix domain-containing protein [Burkholderiaceae bacterium]